MCGNYWCIKINYAEQINETKEPRKLNFSNLVLLTHRLPPCNVHVKVEIYLANFYICLPVISEEVLQTHRIVH